MKGTVFDMSLKLYKGRPEDITDRLEKEIRTYDLLDKLSIQYERVDHEVAETIDACKEIDEILEPASICKNLFLCNAQKTEFYLLMLTGEKKFKTKEVSKQIGCSRLSFSPPEFMEKYLDITPGSVSVMGLMNDSQNRVRLLIDEDIIRSEYIGCHPCINTSSLKLKVADILEVFLKAVDHEYKVVKIAEA